MTKPTEASEVAEPEQKIPVPEASDKQPEEPATDTPSEIADLSVTTRMLIMCPPSHPTHLSRQKNMVKMLWLLAPASENRDVMPG